MVALAIGFVLPGCSIDFDKSQLFEKQVDFMGRNSGYKYSDLQNARVNRPVTANDLIDNNGACAAPPAPQPSPAPGAAPAPDAGSLLGGGIALGMTECEVVSRAGQPTAVQLGRNPNGDRTAVMTYDGGPRPGVYHFERGRLMEMDRMAETPAAQEPAKKKPAKTKKPAKSNDAA